jgi:hypothetical protein
VLYVWKPSITPDHIWADRRFLPVVLPGLLLCAAWLLDRLWARAVAGPRATAVRVAVVAVAVLVVALPALRTWPVAGLHEEAGFAGEVASMCERLGDDAALLLLDESGSAMHYRMTQPLRAHCGVPAAWADESISNERILQLADRAGERTLYVLAARPTTFNGRPTGAPFALLEHRSTRLAPSLTMPPQTLESYGLDVFAAPVDPER